jgi:hypothetical protein
MWRATPAAAEAAARARLRLTTSKRVRAGRRTTLRWSATGADAVTRWQVLLDGRRVASRTGGETGVLRRKVARTGGHRWKVVGYAATGHRVVAATRSFRVVRGG